MTCGQHGSSYMQHTKYQASCTTYYDMRACTTSHVPCALYAVHYTHRLQSITYHVLTWSVPRTWKCALCCSVLCYTLLCFAFLYPTITYWAMPYHTIPYCTALHYTALAELLRMVVSGFPWRVATAGPHPIELTPQLSAWEWCQL